MKRIWLSLFVLLGLNFLMNCSSANLNNPQLRREWMLVSFENYPKEDLIRNKAEIDLTARAENGKIRGGAFMGCNKMFFTAAFKKDGTSAFSDIGSTLMACQNMKLEDDFSRSLKKMQHYQLEGHFLILEDTEGNRMKFVAADWD